MAPVQGPIPVARRIGRNFVANVAAYATSLAAGIVFTPYLVRSLGPAGYGLIPLATSLATYLSLLTLAVTATVGRFVLIAIERGEGKRANELFSTAVITSIGIAVVLALPLGLASWHVERFVRVPAGLVSDARWLFLLAAGAFLVAEFRAVFEVALFATHRLDVRSGLTVADVGVRFGLIVALFTLQTPRLQYVGLGMMVGAAAALAGSIGGWRIFGRTLVLSPRAFSRRALGELLTTGGWMSFGQVGTLLFLAIDLLVVNRLFGSETTGHYAAVLQWSSVLRGLAGAVAVVFAPEMMRLFARGDLPGLSLFTRRVIRIGGSIIALPVGLICGFSEPLLRLWLGADFSPWSPLLWLLTFHLSVNLAFPPLTNILIACDRARGYGIAQTAFGVCNLGLAVLLAKLPTLGVYGVALAGLIVLTAKNVFFTSIFTARQLGLPAHIFLSQGAAPLLVSAVTAGVAYAVGHAFPPSSLPSLAASAALVAIAAGLPLAYFLMNGGERRRVGAILFKRTAA